MNLVYEKDAAQTMRDPFPAVIVSNLWIRCVLHQTSSQSHCYVFHYVDTVINKLDLMQLVDSTKSSVIRLSMIPYLI